MGLILTVPAYAEFEELARKSVVEAVRLNTTLPVKHSLEHVLSTVRSRAGTKPVWVDLKCRQLRIISYGVQILHDHETHYIDVSHNLIVNLPTKIQMDDGNYIGEVTQILNGNRLVVKSSVEMQQGLPLAEQGEIGIRPSMSVNILDPSLKIDGYLTHKDKAYIEAAKRLGMHDYMLSYVEQDSDITDLLALDADAMIVAKIESPKGLEWVRKSFHKFKKRVNLMAARGDLYVEVDMPDMVIDACEQIIRADPNAIIASRLLESVTDRDKIPRCSDLFDVYAGIKMGYTRFMLGDNVCLSKESTKAAINIFDIISKKHDKYESRTHGHMGLFRK